MERFLQTVVDGAALGSVYAALALALVLVFRASGVLNLAQGEMAMFSTFIAWGLVEAGVVLGLAVLLAVAVAFTAGMAIERVLIRPLEGGDHLTLLVLTVGLFMIVNSGAGWIWGFDSRGFPSLFPDEAVELGGVRVALESLGTVGVLIVVVAFVAVVFHRTAVGLAMQAAALEPAASRLAGIRVGRMLMLGWGMAAALGAIAGVLIAPQLFLDVNMMGSVLLYAFAAVALGGLDSPGGAVLAGWIVGISETLAATYVDFVGGDLKLLVPLSIIVVVLLVRPRGLFGSPAAVRA